MESFLSCLRSVSYTHLGGFLIFYVPEEYQTRVKEAMKELVYVPFRFEEGGTRIIHYTPEEYILKK